MRKALEDALKETAGTVAYVNLVEKFSLKDKQDELLKLAIHQGDQGAGPVAADLSSKIRGNKPFEKGASCQRLLLNRIVKKSEGKG